MNQDNVENPLNRNSDNPVDKQYQEDASKFIQETSLDKMIEMAEIARLKKLSEPTKWVIPEDI